MNRQTQEEMIRSARRYTAGIALLSNVDYVFEMMHEPTTTFFINNGRGKVYVTSVKFWECDCPDFEYRKEGCKHLYAAKELLEQQAQVAAMDAEAELYANAEDAEWGCSPL